MNTVAMDFGDVVMVDAADEDSEKLMECIACRANKKQKLQSLVVGACGHVYCRGCVGERTRYCPAQGCGGPLADHSVTRVYGGDDGEHQCSICLESLDDLGAAQLTHCGHLFCVTCFDEYQGTGTNKARRNRYPVACPVCKNAMHPFVTVIPGTVPHDYTPPPQEEVQMSPHGLVAWVEETAKWVPRDRQLAFACPVHMVCIPS